MADMDGVEQHLALGDVAHDADDIVEGVLIPGDLQVKIILGFKAVAKAEGHVKAAAVEPLELRELGIYTSRQHMESDTENLNNMVALSLTPQEQLMWADQPPAGRTWGDMTGTERTTWKEDAKRIRKRVRCSASRPLRQRRARSSDACSAVVSILICFL